MKPIQYVIINKSLEMSAGKVAAQAVHASIMAGTNAGDKKWKLSNQRWVCVLEATDAEQLRSFKTYLAERGITTSLIIDEGVNEIQAYSVTALATEILNKNETDELGYFRPFKLYQQTEINSSWEAVGRFVLFLLFIAVIGFLLFVTNR
jgi:peptidyl-tRNA hydrolase